MGPFAIIGYPVSESMSPALFRAAYPQFPKDTYTYIEAGDCDKALEQMDTLGIQAANITMPLKISCMAYAREKSVAVQQIGAANLLQYKNGLLSALNTDVYGVWDSFKAIDVPLKGQHALVVGAGGAGRAAAWALKEAGAHVFVANRTLHNAHMYALEEIPALLMRCSLVVYTLPIALDHPLFMNLSKWHTVLDASYRTAPLKTTTTRAKALYLNGYHWLYHQAVESFRNMTGLEPNTAAMRRLLGL